MHSEYVYVLKSGPFFKIGRTNEFSKRIAQLKIQLPFEAELFKVINTNDSVKLERYLHRLYRSLRVNGEWFKLTPHDAVMLSIYPCSVDYNNPQGFDDTWEETLSTIANAMEQQARDKALEELIREESDLLFSDFPDSCGDIPYSTLLASECPYPPEPEDMEWVVSDDTEED